MEALQDEWLTADWKESHSLGVISPSSPESQLEGGFGLQQLDQMFEQEKMQKSHTVNLDILLKKIRGQQRRLHMSNNWQKNKQKLKLFEIYQQHLHSNSLIFTE